MMHVKPSILGRRGVRGSWLVVLLLALGLAGASDAGAAGTVTNCATYGDAGTEGDLAWALQGGGTVSFACSGSIVVPEIVIAVDTTIDGTGQIVGLNGNGANRVLFVSGGVHVTLIKLTVTGGNAEDAPGGGMYADSGATVELMNSTVTLNTASAGGGIYAGTSATVTLTDSTVVLNVASAGLGGGINANAASIALTNSTVMVNTAVAGGGGLYAGAIGATVTLTDSTVRTNASAGFGGGIQAFRAVVDLTNSTVSGNTAVASGGGLYTTFTTTELTNSTVSGNTAGGGGGGIGLVAGDALTIDNSTIALNGTATSGGGLNVCGTCTATLAGSIVAGNTADTSGPDCAGAPLSLGYNLIGQGAGCGLIPGTGDLLNTDPLLGPLQDNGGPTFTHALLPGSPAIDAGNPTCPPPATDQRGTVRPQGDACDIGAFEAAPGEMVTISGARFIRLGSVLSVRAGSTFSPEAMLFLTVTGCLTDAPMPWNGRVYAFRQRVRGCGNLDGQTATVTSSHGGMATATIR